MKGLICNDFKCIYSKLKECNAANVSIVNHKCVTMCSTDDLNNLMTQFKGGRADNRVTRMLR